MPVLNTNKAGGFNDIMKGRNFMFLSISERYRGVGTSPPAIYRESKVRILLLNSLYATFTR